jgi:hypothetical protein
VGEIDGANLDMDWAVGEDKRVHVTKLSQMIPRADLLFSRCLRKTPNISIRLPKELDLNELKTMPPHELQRIFLNNEFKFYMAYFGSLIEEEGFTTLDV